MKQTPINIAIGREILLVDDNPTNLKLLAQVVSDGGYVFRVANSGKMALEAVKTKKPDLILLDIQMPGLDGFEVCKMLKENTDTSNIPVIFLSALDDIDSTTHGFQVGAVDYLTKPFNEAEVLARIKTHLTMQIQQNQLIKSEKFASLSELIVGIAHELNTPLGNSIMALSHIEQVLMEFETEILSARPRKTNIESLLEQAKEALNIITISQNKAINLVKTFKQVSLVFSDDEKKEMNVHELFEQIITTLKPEIESKNVTLQLQGDENLTIKSIPRILLLSLSQLVLNATQHAFNTSKIKRLHISYSGTKDSLKIVIKDSGCGIESDKINRIFDPFYTTNRAKGGSGLGMNIVYNLVTQKLNGNIFVKDKQENGALFIIECPIQHTIEKSKV